MNFYEGVCIRTWQIYIYIYTGTWNDNPSTIPSTATSCRRPFNPAQIASDALETVSNTQV